MQKEQEKRLEIFFHLNAKIVSILLNMWASFVFQPVVRDELQHLQKKKN